MPYFRRISPAEATYLAKDRLGSGQFVNQFFIEGELTDENAGFRKNDWHAAIKKAAAKNPGICVQLAGFWGFRYWRTVDILPRLIHYDRDSADEWNGESSSGFEKVAEYINPRTDTNATITLISDRINKRAMVLFRIHHGLCDGAATAHWIQEVFRALKDQPLVGSISTINETTIIKRTDYPKPDTFRGRCLPVFPGSENPEAGSCHWVRCHWDISEQRIVAKLLIALRKIACDEHGEGRTVFRLTSDLRHHLTENEMRQVQFSNMSGIFDIEVNDEDSVKSVQFRIIKALRHKRDLSVFPKKMISLTPWLPGKLFNLSPKGAADMHRRGVCNITAMIGYANHIDLEAVSYEAFEATGAFAIPMDIEDKSIFMGVASSPNGIDVIISAPNALSDIEKTRSLAMKLEKILKEIEKNG